MINPNAFLSSNDNEEQNLTDMDGSFGCPEMGCYEYTTNGKFDSRTRVLTWTCINGHKGSVTL